MAERYQAAVEMSAWADQRGVRSDARDLSPEHRVTAERVADPGEAVYLASEASSFVTGDDIAVSGGMPK